MDRSKKERTVKRQAFTKALNAFNENCQTQASYKVISVSFQLLEEKMQELVIASDKYLDLLYDAAESTAESVEKETEESDEYRRKFLEARATMEELKLHNKCTVPNDCDSASGVSVVSTHRADTRRSFKLPKIELVKFSGSIREWLPFWSLFKKIHENTFIDNEERFQYLLQAMVPGSRAAELVQSFPPTAENYEKVIKSLKDRFGRNDLQVEVYVRDLLQLVLNSGRISVSLSTLYDKIESYLRALATLGVTADKYAAMLFPLVESCLPEELLRTWQRYCTMAVRAKGADTESSEAKDRLTLLIHFLEDEVRNELRISMATEKFGFNAENNSHSKSKRSVQVIAKTHVPSATNLLATKENKCLFCDSNHNSAVCERAKKMSLNERQEVVKIKNACFNCLKIGHRVKDCRVKNKCEKCTRRHVTIMCRSNELENSYVKPPTITEVSCASLSNCPSVFLQTLKVKLKGKNSERVVRALIDTGSQHSYILTSVANEMQFEPIDSLMMNHILFGGSQKNLVKHRKYQVRVTGVDEKFHCNFVALDQDIICESVPAMKNGIWCKELRKLKIKLSDLSDSDDKITMLIGSDIAGKLKTGRVHHLSCGLTAEETKLGWVLSGKVPGHMETGDAITAISMYLDSCNVEDLWSLDILGIRDPITQKSHVQQEEEIKAKFLNTVTVNNESRYEVPLPWTDNHPPLSSNKNVAMRRLQSTTKKLQNDGYYDKYDAIFKQWLEAGIIEYVPTEEEACWGHYLPHRHVIKENSTTAVRPVFDASSKLPPHPSLNDCLHKGPNLIELISDVLLRFRIGNIGVTSDIEKAFLQISVNPKDRDFLRFFWYSDDGKVVVLRHCRVVFGVCSSPFILGAIIEYHLNNMLSLSEVTPNNNKFSKNTIVQLLSSFYVDNCVTSFNSSHELNNFISDAKYVMGLAGFNLRGWEFNGDNSHESRSNVLGIVWDKIEDTLFINTSGLVDFDLNSVTKRSILSAAHRVFDPLGIVSAVTLTPRIILQETWGLGLSWDQSVDECIKLRFVKWLNGLKDIGKIRVPRCLLGEIRDTDDVSLHTFVDASKVAYATVIFLRVQRDNNVKVSFVQAKSRIAPTKKGKSHHSIPRLELLAATIGARLTASILKILNVKDLKVYYWSDSSTVLAWIHRKNNWATFVWNRVEEIRSLSNYEQWKHVPGPLNPADLPSRGCTIEQLLSSSWWEGPIWLRKGIDNWPLNACEYNEEEINCELKKSCVKHNNSIISLFAANRTDTSFNFEKFSSYFRILRTVAWIRRFCNNARGKEKSLLSFLTAAEIKSAETNILKLTQSQSFHGIEDKDIIHLEPFVDEVGLIRVKSKIFWRNDKYDFRCPIVLPRKNHLVRLIIKRQHEELKHAGVQILLNSLREKFWILGGRKEVRSVIDKCLNCRRHDAKPFNANPTPLPLNRVRDANVFEVIGVDFAGPIFIKENQKSWICIFTCAVYRAVHFELVNSLSTASFLMSLRRFIARRGRPSVIYSDNGKNFEGLGNKLRELDFEKIAEQVAMQQIDWHFNPPLAAWWGGFWERLIGILKRLLRRSLQKLSLNYEEMLTVLIDCEAVINSRPITFTPDSDSEVVPLTPSHFLQEIREIGVIDLDKIESCNLGKKEALRVQIKKSLRERFRKEYLGALMHHKNRVKKCTNNFDEPKINEIVFVGNDNTKRMDWPLAKVKEVIYGKDNQIRVLRLSTAKGELIRPVQRVFPLELRFKSDNVSEAIEQKNNIVVTRAGRKCKKPDRLTY